MMKAVNAPNETNAFSVCKGKKVATTKERSDMTGIVTFCRGEDLPTTLAGCVDLARPKRAKPQLALRLRSQYRIPVETP
ncbi:hypothetical protein GCM10025858_17430 [Alicyclobacillus sacchari]|nr:hypothetical protein GCM10025858_17430 [Alicyclobacillus sacchari]